MSGELFRESLVPCTTTANALAGYRDELLACGFSLSVSTELVLIAARNMDTLDVGPLFLARAAPPAPIVRIENHEPGSAEDLAARAEYAHTFIRMWDAATPEQRVEIAERIVTESEQAKRCFLANHEWQFEQLRQAQAQT